MSRNAWIGIILAAAAAFMYVSVFLKMTHG